MCSRILQIPWAMRSRNFANSMGNAFAKFCKFIYLHKLAHFANSPRTRSRNFANPGIKTKTCRFLHLFARHRKFAQARTFGHANICKFRAQKIFANFCQFLHLSKTLPISAREFLRKPKNHRIHVTEINNVLIILRMEVTRC
jgi:hypothetical protein